MNRVSVNLVAGCCTEDKVDSGSRVKMLKRSQRRAELLFPLSASPHLTQKNNRGGNIYKYMSHSIERQIHQVNNSSHANLFLNVGGKRVNLM